MPFKRFVDVELDVTRRLHYNMTIAKAFEEKFGKSPMKGFDIYSPDEISFLCFQMFVGKDPELTLEKTYDIIPGDMLNEIVQGLVDVMGLIIERPTDPAAPGEPEGGDAKN